MHAVIGMNSKVGDWTRVEGTPNDPNPNKPFAKTDNHPLFNQEGKLNPSITIVGKFFFYELLIEPLIELCFLQGCNVVIPSEVVLLNSVVLPHKQLSQSIKNEIVL